MSVSAPSALSPLKLLWRTPPFALMTLTIFMLGLASSFVIPFMSLYGVEQIGMKPLWLGAFMTSLSVSSIVLSTLLARWSDRLPSRRPAVLVALLSGTLGYSLLSVTHTYWPALLIAVSLLAVASAGFPQLFTYARSQLAQSEGGKAQPQLAEHGVTLLRSVFSLAWVAGPALGAVVLQQLHFGGLFLTVGGLYLLTALPVLTRRSPHSAAIVHSEPLLSAATSSPGAATSPAAVDPPVSISLIALSFTLYAASLSAQMIALPLFVTQELHGNAGQVGLLLGLCALLEIPIMLSFVLLPRRYSSETLLLLGFALAVLMTLLMALTPNMGLALVSQMVRAVVIAISSCIGMAYFQDLMPGRMGIATTLFANTSNAGAVLAGLMVGGVAQIADYRTVFWACLLLNVLAWLLLRSGTRAKRHST